jgi:hypothetical protein
MQNKILHKYFYELVSAADKVILIVRKQQQLKYLGFKESVLVTLHFHRTS